MADGWLLVAEDGLWVPAAGGMQCAGVRCCRRGHSLPGPARLDSVCALTDFSMAFDATNF